MQEILQEYLSKEEKAYIYVDTWKDYFTILKLAKDLGAKWLGGDEINTRRWLIIRKFKPCILAVGKETLAFLSFFAAQFKDKFNVVSFRDLFNNEI